MLSWLLLTFSAGSVNASGFIITGRFVTHVTGFATLFGAGLVSGEALAAFRVLTVPLFFLLGALLSGLFIDRQIYLRKKPHFDVVMLLSATFLILAALIDHGRQLLALGVMPAVQDSYAVLALLCCSSGLQNAALTSASGATIRTTHMTGLTTDLGLGLARMATVPRRSREFTHEWHRSLLRAGTFTAFALGSLIGAFSTFHLRSWALLIPASISMYAAWHGRRDKLTPRHPTNL